MKHNINLLLTIALLAFKLPTVCGETNQAAVSTAKINSALIPAIRTNADWWMPRHEQVLKRMAEGNVDMIFIGDSITHYWESKGKTVWDQYYAPRHAVNLGFSGDKTQNVLWRLEHGEVDNIHPKLAVLMIGTNNRNRAEQTAEAIKAIVGELNTRLPETKVLILGVFPRGRIEDRKDEKILQSGTNDLWTTNEKVNHIISGFADNKSIYYLNINQSFLKDGTVPREYMPDFLHPSEKGYQIWAEAIEPIVKKLMGEK